MLVVFFCHTAQEDETCSEDSDNAWRIGDIDYLPNACLLPLAFRLLAGTDKCVATEELHNQSPQIEPDHITRHSHLHHHGRHPPQLANFYIADAINSHC